MFYIHKFEMSVCKEIWKGLAMKFEVPLYKESTNFLY